MQEIITRASLRPARILGFLHSAHTSIQSTTALIWALVVKTDICEDTVSDFSIFSASPIPISSISTLDLGWEQFWAHFGLKAAPGSFPSSQGAPADPDE